MTTTSLSTLLSRYVADPMSAAAALVLVAAGAQATPYELVYSGTFDTTESLTLASAASPSFFSASTPFTVHALFDTASPNLAPTFGGPFGGFRAYSPSVATIQIAGRAYSIEPGAANPSAGVTVAVFDRNSFTPGRYGVGLIANPFADGSGFVGDFVSASPDFVAGALTPTVFGDYAGVGHSSGVCTSGTAPACPHLVTPWVLHDAANLAWSLAIGNYEEDYQVLSTPGATLGTLNTAVILAAVPEPSTYGLMLAGFVGIAGLAMWRRRRRGRSPTA